MDLIRKTEIALRKAVKEAGSQVRLAEVSGIKQPNINRFLSGKSAAQNMKLETLMSLFPELEITFFQDDLTAKTQSLPPIIRKIVDIVNELDEDSQLDLLTDIVRLIEQHKINRRK